MWERFMQFLKNQPVRGGGDLETSRQISKDLPHLCFAGKIKEALPSYPSQTQNARDDHTSLTNRYCVFLDIYLSFIITSS